MQPVHNIHDLADKELAARYRDSGDLELLGVLYKRYSHLVYGVCLKYLRDRDDSQDAVMQIFEKLVTDLRRHPVEYFKSWLHTVAKNHCLMQLRSRKGHAVPLENETTLEVVESHAALHPDNEDREGQLKLMEKGLETLNHEQRTCVELFYLRQLSYQQVAEQTGYTLLQVKSYIQNGKRNLRIFIDTHHEPSP